MLGSEITELRGASVSLSSFLPSDITADYISWLNDPEVTRYSNQRFVLHSEESCAAYLASFEGTPNSFLSIRSVADGRAVGTMTAYVSPHHETVDLGIMIGNRDVWGEGLGQEAWNTLLQWFHRDVNMRKVTGGTMRCNVGMMKLLERSGMTLESVRPRQEMLDGTEQDLCYFAKYREDR